VTDNLLAFKALDLQWYKHLIWSSGQMSRWSIS